jgi:hypothetical protein
LLTQIRISRGGGLGCTEGDVERSVLLLEGDELFLTFDAFIGEAGGFLLGGGGFSGESGKGSFEFAYLAGEIGINGSGGALGEGLFCGLLGFG